MWFEACNRVPWDAHRVPCLNVSQPRLMGPLSIRQTHAGRLDERPGFAVEVEVKVVEEEACTGKGVGVSTVRNE